MIQRLPLLNPSPVVDCGRWPAKSYVGEVVPFSVTTFREGHGELAAELVLTAPDGTVSRHRLHGLAEGTDRWGTSAVLDQQGEWRFHFASWCDEFASWWKAALVKVSADIDSELMLAIGAQLLSRAAETITSENERLVYDAAAILSDANSSPQAALDQLAASGVVEAMQSEQPLRDLESHSEEHVVRVERSRAGVGAWYELFPRSVGAKKLRGKTWRSGTFRTAAKDLPRIAAMGFDVVYLPPIHPIGTTFRKGPNNTLTAGPGDPGSPWAIGSPEGGHDAIHPDLGTVDDFAFFVAAARKRGIEVALDFALQCSPDHPWVTEHPEWFTVLPDGSIAYAENPPKKYQDIVPINFDRDPQGIRDEVLRIVELWIERGVRIFRVDNPHTKAFDFWEWLISRVNDAHPDVVFLAEAFTRPALLTTLGKLGFQQSYSYFTWRNTKEELEEFLQSISHETADYVRPNLFVNTPDILTEYLQYGGVPAFKVRAALAATASPSWGMYSGFELFESVARPGAEEYIDNEKYEFRPRDFAGAVRDGASLEPYITMLGRLRREHPALAQLRNLTLLETEDDSIVAYVKHLDAAFAGGVADTVIVVANVDPHSVRETVVHVDPAVFGVQPGEQFTVTDAVTGAQWQWGERNYVRLDAFTEPVHILIVEAQR